MAAVSLGVTVMSADEGGAPRLVRTVTNRPGRSGISAEQAAREHLASMKSLYMSKRAASDLASAGSQKLRNGSTMVRLQQQVDGIDIHQGELRVLVGSDNSLAAISGTMLPTAARTTFKSSPKAALERALDEMYGKTRSRPVITEGADSAGYRMLTVATDDQVNVKSARAKRELMQQGDKLVGIWNIEVFGDKPAFDGREPTGARYLIADQTGNVLRTASLLHRDAFVYRAFADQSGNRRPFDGASKSFNPHPTGTPDGSLPGIASSNLVTMDAFNQNNDPWLPADATSTSGNNVDAFADINPPSGFSDGDIRAEVRTGRILNYQYDFNAGPLATPTQSKAAVVNSFFVVNWLHDWWYDSGFTESTGNGQVDNYGRGGVGGDPIILHAQDNANGGSRDNAFMSTPADGLSPEMHMFLWSGGTVSSLTAPTGSPTTGIFVNGPSAFNLTGTVVLAQNGTANDACTAVTNPAAIAGKIAMFKFAGICGSVTAVNNVKAAGAIGAIAMIDVAGLPAQNLNGSAAANIPGLVIGFDDGNALIAALPATATLKRSTKLERDGDMDNAIVAHEWGHYLHHRLASCEAAAQCRAMSEGWGDFNALLMMLRSNDETTGAYQVGLHALTAGGLEAFGFTDPGYFGIRRLPYSLNRTKNPTSFKNIGDDNPLPDTAPVNPGPGGGANSEVHNAGEIWTTMLWEAYNALIDEHGLNEARRRMTDIVVAGLLLTPPEATMTEGRDALIAAAGGLDSDDMILIAAAFAGRGAGSCAIGPDRESFDNSGIVESGTIAAKIETTALTLTDDGASCDNDGILDPGESGILRLSIANGGVLAAENIRIRPRTTSSGVSVGGTIRIAKLAPFTSADIEIPVTVSSGAPVDSNLDITVTLTSNAGCDTGNVQLAIHQRLGVDEADAVSTTDNVETSITPWQRTGDSGTDIWGIVRGGDGNHSWFGIDAPFTSDTHLVSPVFQVGTTAPFVVTLSHAFSLEELGFGTGIYFDGGVIEVSTDGGATFRDVSEVGVDPGYVGEVSIDFDNPLAGRQAFSGDSASFPARQGLTLNFGTQFAGQSVQLRFRIGTDFCCTAVGWDIDDISATGITNTPFPGFIPEPTVCNAPNPLAGSVVTGTHSGEARSLNGVGGVSQGSDEL